MWVWVAIGGAIGALFRFWIASWVQRKVGISFPFGTLTVNVLGSFIIGFFIQYGLEYLSLPPQFRAFVVVGFLGALTTFSSFSYETVSLFTEGEFLKALTYFLLTNIFCFVATFGGLVLARLISS